METIYQSQFAKHAYDRATKTLYSDWYKETASMTAEDFKSEMREWLHVFRKCRPWHLYDNCVAFSYPIVPEEQSWMANLLNAEWIALGLKKYAHMVPGEMITELSVEQLFDEFFQMNLKDQFPIMNFSDKDLAIQWLHEGH